MAGINREANAENGRERIAEPPCGMHSIRSGPVLMLKNLNRRIRISHARPGTSRAKDRS
jgi:hypothetical protein